VIDTIDRDLQTKVGDYPWQSPSFGNWNILEPQNVGDDHGGLISVFRTRLAFDLGIGAVKERR
jgi:hypothetical protein